MQCRLRLPASDIDMLIATRPTPYWLASAMDAAMSPMDKAVNAGNRKLGSS
jgi:hypothetical protein